MNILLIHQYAGNKGDRAVLYALVKMLKQQDEHVNITVSTSDPNLWCDFSSYAFTGVTFVPSAWDFEKLNSIYWNFLNKKSKYAFTVLRELFLRGCAKPFVKYLVHPQFYKTLKNSDAVISVGGHHFTTILSRDLVSSINYDAMSVLALNKDLICFSQSFGPFTFHNVRNLLLTRKILNSCQALYSRESEAKSALIDFGIKEEIIHDTFETVLTLNDLFPNYVLPSKRKKIVGIAIYATQKREPSVYEHYVDSIAQFCDYVNSKDYEVRFFPMELKGTPPDDRILINDIMSRVKVSSMCNVYDEDMNTPQHLQEVAKCQVFVGHKTHSTIFALATGTPLIGIAYHPKTIQFMKQFGVEQYVIDDKNLNTVFLTQAFDKISTQCDEIGKHLYDQSALFTKYINADLKDILNGK